MGYRNYFYSLPREEYEQIKDMTNAELNLFYKNPPEEEFNYLSIPNIKLIHEFGKYCDFDINHTLSGFFTNNSNDDSDTEFSIANRETFRIIIKDYINKITTNYQILVDENNPEKLLQYSIANLSEWDMGWAIDLNKDNPSISTSWKYEYIVFELVRIYKSFDYKNNILIYCGY